MSNLLYNLTDLNTLLQVFLRDLFEVFLCLPALVIIANYIVCLVQYAVNEEKTDIQDNIKFLRYLFWPTHLLITCRILLIKYARSRGINNEYIKRKGCK